MKPVVEAVVLSRILIQIQFDWFKPLFLRLLKVFFCPRIQHTFMRFKQVGLATFSMMSYLKGKQENASTVTL